MNSREAALKKIAVGDIVFAEVGSIGTAICLILEVTETSIRARDICRRDSLLFDKATGVAPDPWPVDFSDYRIVSTARLPDEMHAVLLAYDKRRSRPEPLSDEEFKLTAPERYAIAHCSDVYDVNRI